MSLEELKNMIDLEIASILTLSKIDNKSAQVKLQILQGSVMQLYHEFLSDADRRFYQRQEDLGGLHDDPKNRVEQRA